MYCQTLTSKKSIVELLKFGAGIQKIMVNRSPLSTSLYCNLHIYPTESLDRNLFYRSVRQ